MMTIYSDGEFTACKSEKHPYIDDESERRKVYAQKEFTLVLTPHTMHNGIPRNLLEVIAAGGFPLCGFQRDYAYFFSNNENLVWFSDMEGFNCAVVKYGNNHEERERVRTAAYQTVAEGHTYRHRIATMLDMWGKL
jgi:spore maturation protein CgeB